MPKNGRSGLPTSMDAVTFAIVVTSRCPTYGTYDCHTTRYISSTQASIAAECDGSMRLVLRKDNATVRIRSATGLGRLFLAFQLALQLAYPFGHILFGNAHGGNRLAHQHGHTHGVGGEHRDHDRRRDGQRR